ncbi:MAG: DUF3109 family protein [Anaerolineaceae bacterium]|jgi:hypothetical protein|nr:DUF3109 family protein [Anaerolineaceae bacterium]
MKMEINPRLLQSEPIQRCKLHNCRAACCLYGVWIDEKEVEILLANAERIAPHMPAGKGDPATWFDERRDADPFSASGRVRHSDVVDAPDHYGGTACVFLRSDHKCALQVASEASGHHPWQWKPFYCILHPLDLDDEDRITIDETELLLAEEGSCLRPAPQPILLLETFEEELRFFLGDEKYERLRRNV